MGSPHLRRRYRATGTRSGLTYLFLILGAATLYVGQRVYAGREQAALDLLGAHVNQQTQYLGRLAAQRDSLLSLAIVRPKAVALGLRSVGLGQLARLPLSAPRDPQGAMPASPVQFSQTADRIWKWLDPPGIESQEVAAAE